MDYRKLLLRGMLSALALAACSGVLAIVIPHTDFAWRLSAMGGIGAVIAAVMLAMSRWVDGKETRAAGLFGMAVCVLEFVLSVALVWGDVFSSRFQEFTGISMLLVAMVGIPAMLCVRLMGDPASRLAGMLGLGGLAGALGCLEYAAAEEWYLFGGGSDRWWRTGFSIFFPVLLSVMCMVGLAKPDPRRWRWVGVLGAAAALGISMYGIWISSGGDPTPLAVSYAVAAVTAHAILCLRLKIPEGAGWVRLGTIAAGMGTAGLICATVYVGGSERGDEMGLWRLATGAGIVGASGTLALLVLARFGRRTHEELAPREITTVALTCPRCARKVTVPIGGGACAGCRLRITVTVENPRCAKCDYDLTGITGDKCPECGTLISSR